MTKKEQNGIKILVFVLFTILILASLYSTVIQEKQREEKQAQLDIAIEQMQKNQQKEATKLQTDSNRTNMVVK